MSQNQAGRWVRRAVWITFAAIFTLGCNPLATFSFLTQSDPVKSAEYPLTFDKGPKQGKEVVVALFISSSPGIGPAFAGTEAKLAYGIAKRLPEMAKEAQKPQKLVVVDPQLVSRFKMNNPNWKLMHASEWGKKLKADYVLDINLKKMSLYQQNSVNLLYEGQAEVDVSVYDVDAGQTEPRNYILAFKYPGTGVIAADSIPIERFRQDYLEHLASEICMKHVPHKEALGIADK